MGTTHDTIAASTSDEVEVAQVQERPEHHRQLVGRGRAGGVEAPVLEQLLVPEEPHMGLRVADVDREQHRAASSHAMIRLYRAPWSTNVERVTLALAHKGLEAESVWIEYSDRSEVERVSGQGLVPVIDDDGTVVSDSLAILRHLEERHPDPPLFPADPARRAELDVFLDWFDRVWKVAPNAIEADPSRTDELAAVMDGHLDLFEAMLAGPRPPDGRRVLGRGLRRLPVPQVRRCRATPRTTRPST